MSNMVLNKEKEVRLMEELQTIPRSSIVEEQQNEYF